LPSPSSPGPGPIRPVDLVVLGNLGGRRLDLLGQALARRGQAPARVVSYRDYLAGRVRIAEALRAGSVLRIESPGQDFEVEKGLLAEGDGPIGQHELKALAFDRGRLLAPGQWYRGFCRLLERVESDRRQGPAHRLVNDPGEIAVLFDKVACHDRLAALGIPCPRALGPVGSYAELRARMRDRGVGRAFVKLRWGSSASGIVAVETSGARAQAFTTVEMAGGPGGPPLLYNTRKIRRLVGDREIEPVVDALAAEGVHVEPWAPKAGIEGEAFDLRVVVIGGESGHVVVRQSRGPMTNLHLKNRRGRVDLVRARMGESAWGDLLATCRRVGGAFGGCRHVGVDVAVLPGFRRHLVLEANAFGDLLPGVVDDLGRDTYEAELALIDREAPR
jgi:hypothetical protein